MIAYLQLAESRFFIAAFSLVSRPFMVSLDSSIDYIRVEGHWYFVTFRRLEGSVLPYCREGRMALHWDNSNKGMTILNSQK